MQNYYYKDCNFNGWYQDLGLEPNRDFMWLLHHEKRTDFAELLQLPKYQTANNIFLVDSESIHCDPDAEWINDSRIHFFMPCVSEIDRCQTYHFWFSFMREIELHLKYNNKLIESHNKKYMFDALLGTPKNHKDVIKKYIDNSSNGNQFFVNYTGNPQNSKNCKWVNGSDLESEETGIIEYNKQSQLTANASCIIPYKIYNQCYYSLVCESVDQPLFYTEKTGKPLLSKRVFVMFSGKHHLKHLREFGFCTFDGIIDESYDEIDNRETRYAEAWKQVEFLLTQDPVAIYNRSKEILDHNYNHFMQTDWQENMFKKIQNILHSSK